MQTLYVAGELLLWELFKVVLLHEMSHQATNPQPWLRVLHTFAVLNASHDTVVMVSFILNSNYQDAFPT